MQNIPEQWLLTELMFWDVGQGLQIIFIDWGCMSATSVYGSGV